MEKALRKWKGRKGRRRKYERKGMERKEEGKGGEEGRGCSPEAKQFRRKSWIF